MEEGFSGFRYRPVDSAACIRVPTLLMNGDQDEWVCADEARAIFDALKGPKTLRLFAGVGHDSCLRHRPEEWMRAVAEFLAEHASGDSARLSRGGRSK